MARNVLHLGIFDDHSLAGDLVLARGLERNGCSVERVDYRSVLRRGDNSELARMVTERARVPDLVLIGKRDGLDPGLLARAAQADARVALWYGDYRPAPPEWLRALLLQVDCLSMTSAGETLRSYFEAGRPGRAGFFLNPFDPAILEQYREPIVRDLDVLFTGTACSFAGNEKRAVIRYLRRRPDTVVVGGSEDMETLTGLGRRTFRRVRKSGPPTIRGEDYARMIRRALVGIGIGATHDVNRYRSDRLSDYLGLDTFYLCRRFAGIEDLFEVGMDLECFESVDELDLMIGRFRIHPEERSKIAASGQRLICERYDCSTMTRMMLDVIFRGESDVYPWVEVLQ